MITLNYPLLGITITLSILSRILINYIYNYLHLRHIPGPTPLPLLGNLHHKNFITKFGSFVRDMRARYGGLFLVWGATTPLLVVTDPDLIRTILTKHQIFVKGPMYEKVFSICFGDGLVTSSGEKHKRDKALLGRYFQKKNVDDYLPMFVQETRKVMEEIVMGRGDETEHNFAYIFGILTLRMFMRFSLDHDITKDDPGRDPSDYDEFIEGVSYYSQVLGSTMMFNLPTNRYINPMWNYMHTNMHRIYTWIDHIVNVRRQKQERKEEGKDDILAALLKSNQTTDGFRSHFITLLCAGHETTGFFECYIAYCLAQNPAIQTRLKNEIKSVLGDRDTVTPDDISKMKYLQAVMKEALRMYTVIPSMLRMTNEDVFLGKYKVPKNTMCVIPMAACNKFGDVWENPYEFNPDRFKDIASEQSPKHGYIPFGYGQRSCIGMTLAIQEAAVVFALLLQKVTLTSVEGYKPKFPRYSISRVLQNGLPLKVTFDKEE